jgi:TIM-barrel protein
VTVFEPRVARASLSGRSDALWARAGSGHAGAAFLGGIALDEATRAGARELVDRGRNEFLPPDPVAFVDGQLATLAAAPVRGGVNVRTTTLDPLARVAAVCARYDALVEINAHCRQDEICRAGAGETLLADPERLCEQVRVASDQGAVVGVKVRAEVAGVDLPALARRLERAGAALVHVDAMDSEPVVGRVADATGLFVVANNGVRDRQTVREYLAAGADAVSVGRPSDDPAVLSRVHAAVEDWFGAAGDRELEDQPDAVGSHS